MRPTSARRRTAALAALLLGAGLALSACGSDDGGSSSAGGKSPGEGKAECEGLTSYGDLTGKTVKVYTSIVEPEATSQKKSYELFTTCTGAKVAYEGSKEFEAQLVVRVKSGNPPDIAYVPQPGLLATLVKDTGKVVEAPKAHLLERRQVLGRGLEEVRHGRRQVLRRPAGRQREVVRLVLPRDVQEERLDGPDDVGRDDGALRQDRRDRDEAVVLRRRVR